MMRTATERRILSTVQTRRMERMYSMAWYPHLLHNPELRIVLNM